MTDRYIDPFENDTKEELKKALRECLELLYKSNQYVGSNIYAIDSYWRLTE